MTQFERIFSFMKKPWMIILYFVVGILVYNFVDIPLATYFHQFDFRKNLHFLNIFTSLGQWKAYIILFFLTGLFFRFVRVNPIFEAKSWYLLGCILIPNLIGFALKIILSRARPELLFESHYFGFYWFKLNDAYWSFPSGHTITVIALSCGLAILLPNYFYVFLGLALLVACSRVLLYHHYLSDVMAGFYFSLLVTGFYIHYLKKTNWFKKIS